MVIFLCIISLIILVLLLLPFLKINDSLLEHGAAIDSVAELQKQKAQLLKRYLQEEMSFNNKSISSREWQGRQQFLCHRFIDITRRIDWLQTLAAQKE